MNSDNKAQWIADAADMLAEYQQYGEAMRKHGRGFEPTGKLGHDVTSVIAALRGLLA